jgi:hypothetical protein
LGDARQRVTLRTARRHRNEQYGIDQQHQSSPWTPLPTQPGPGPAHHPGPGFPPGSPGSPPGSPGSPGGGGLPPGPAPAAAVPLWEGLESVRPPCWTDGAIKRPRDAAAQELPDDPKVRHDMQAMFFDMCHSKTRFYGSQAQCEAELARWAACEQVGVPGQRAREAPQCTRLH